jgi:6-phospho-3-hexuloisomerase
MTNHREEVAMFHDLAKQVTNEITACLNDIDENLVAELVLSILGARQIVVHGAGRVGLACRGFAMRLGHVGLNAFTVTDATVPPLAKGDLLIIGSSSGETQTVYDVAVHGKKNGAQVVVVTANTESRMASVADTTIFINAPTKFGPTEKCSSIQPMATLFEQCVQLLFDVVVLLLMNETNQTHNDLWVRHSNLD